ncbi:siroheme decarboxylase subunit beta [Marinicrinis sediminis]|uniref:siroheme decarboxylase n=1 Tax=Marinicrinis sediminis TaxID=1652465 RepID=A0ABW5RE54_9BACL
MSMTPHQSTSSMTSRQSASSFPLTELERSILRLLQDEWPLVPQPYQWIANQLGIEQEELFQHIDRMKASGLIRRIGMVMRHRKMGITANPMIVWRVPESRLNELGEWLAEQPEVTHAYHRPMLPDFPYNLYCMIHMKTTTECEAFASRLSRISGIADYQLLYSTKELKKSSMRYV